MPRAFFFLRPCRRGKVSLCWLPGPWTGFSLGKVLHKDPVRILLDFKDIAIGFARAIIRPRMADQPHTRHHDHYFPDGRNIQAPTVKNPEFNRQMNLNSVAKTCSDCVTTSARRGRSPLQGCKAGTPWHDSLAIEESPQCEDSVPGPPSESPGRRGPDSLGPGLTRARHWENASRSRHRGDLHVRQIIGKLSSPGSGIPAARLYEPAVRRRPGPAGGPVADLAYAQATSH